MIICQNCLEKGVASRSLGSFLSLRKGPWIRRCDWQDTSILVMKTVLISKPYRPEDCTQVGPHFQRYRVPILNRDIRKFAAIFVKYPHNVSDIS